MLYVRSAEPIYFTTGSLYRWPTSHFLQLLALGHHGYPPCLWEFHSFRSHIHCISDDMQRLSFSVWLFDPARLRSQLGGSPSNREYAAELKGPGPAGTGLVAAVFWRMSGHIVAQALKRWWRRELADICIWAWWSQKKQVYQGRVVAWARQRVCSLKVSKVWSWPGAQAWDTGEHSSSALDL